MQTYVLKVDLPGEGFAGVLERTRKALAEEGFGIPTEMDTRALFQQKLGKDSPARVILGACLAPVAYEVLALEPDLAALLPCNVVVREHASGCEVTAVAPTALFTLARNVDRAQAEFVEARLRAVLDRVAGRS